MPISRFTEQKSSYISEDLSEQIDGNTIVFSLSAYKNTTLMVFWNGVRQSLSEITLTSDTSFSTSFVAESGDSLIATFIKL